MSRLNAARVLSDRIRAARRDAGMSQTALARLVGVNPSAVSQWETLDGTRPTTRNLECIARRTGVAFEWLATGSIRDPAPAEVPALVLGSFAHSIEEEELLNEFRTLRARERSAVLSTIRKLASKQDSARTSRRPVLPAGVRQRDAERVRDAVDDGDHNRGQ